jgi:hypothetical protein
MIPADQPLFLPSCHSYVRTIASIARVIIAATIERRAYLHLDCFIDRRLSNFLETTTLWRGSIVMESRLWNLERFVQERHNGG